MEVSVGVANVPGVNPGKTAGPLPYAGPYEARLRAQGTSWENEVR